MSVNIFSKIGLLFPCTLLCSQINDDVDDLQIGLYYPVQFTRSAEQPAPLQIRHVDYMNYYNPELFWDYKFIPNTYVTFHADCPKGFRVHEDLVCGE